MKPTNKQYTGKPFIGISSVKREDNPDDTPLIAYCLLEQGKKVPVMHSLLPGPENPWWSGIGGLVAGVVSAYGENYAKHTTFDPPGPNRVGRDEIGWCKISYERLSSAEQKIFALKAKEWADSPDERTEYLLGVTQEFKQSLEGAIGNGAN